MDFDRKDARKGMTIEETGQFSVQRMDWTIKFRYIYISISISNRKNNLNINAVYKIIIFIINIQGIGTY